MSADPVMPDTVPATLSRLLGQHPSAIRSVCFSEEPHTPEALGHLEIETKHGFVTLIDHSSGLTYANPPAPPAVDVHQNRRQRDLADELPGAFAGRPKFSAVEPIGDGDRLTGWRFVLDTGAAFTLTLDEQLPIVTASS